MSYTASHWGAYEVDRSGTSPVLRALSNDPEPTTIGLDQLGDGVARLRIRRPAIRKGWLEGGAASRATRGLEPFVEVSWERAIELLARELDRVIGEHGNEGIFGGSYGWASAGRFHHAQGQLKRFLNLIGGFVRHQDSYSFGAANVVLPHIAGDLNTLLTQHTSWEVIAEHTDLFVAFGGIPRKNAQVSPGGAVVHQVQASLDAMARRGVRLVNISPQRTDLKANGEVEWIPIRPNTDVALLLGIATTLIEEGLHDRAFLASHCVGFEVVEAYLTGGSDGTRRDADWASRITTVPAERIRRLAREMASARTMVNMAWSLQRAAHGEQACWATITVAAMLGQIGLAGGGFGIGYGTVNNVGSAYEPIKGPTFPQGRNPVEQFIPVARIADMLLNPREEFDYNGKIHTYPDIRLVYWAGGNPFHHHQDLNRLQSAWRRPDTVVVNEQFWNASARMADIVLPATTSLERNDIAFSTQEGYCIAMPGVVEPLGEARNDHDIFAALAKRMNVGPAFSEGRDEMAWLEHLYEECRTRATQVDLPRFENFWEAGMIEIKVPRAAPNLLEDFRHNPEVYRLSTPSGRIELHSHTVAAFGYDDCPGHAVWLEPFEWLGDEAAAQYPLHLLSNQPERRLHSQLDHSGHSVAGKLHGRERLSLSSIDAAVRNIADGDLIEIFNSRGRCMAAAIVTDTIAPGSVSLSTGAWFDPERWDGQSLEKHGNPNVLTRDTGASRLSQACSAQTCLVEIRRFAGDVPAVSAHDVSGLLVDTASHVAADVK